MFFDAALTYDPAGRRCDLTLGDDGDLLIDETPVTPMLLSVGLDRRAAPDDPLPAGRDVFLAAASFSDRRGWPGDALDPAGERCGSRLWLLDRAKATETTELLFRFWLEEAFAWVPRETGAPAEIGLSWLKRDMLGWRVAVGDEAIEFSRRLA